MSGGHFDRDNNPDTSTDAVSENDVSGQGRELSIIVWCVGGVLLISLLSLLARIILAKKKRATNGQRHRRSNTVRICLDGPVPFIMPEAPPSDCSSSISGSVVSANVDDNPPRIPVNALLQNGDQERITSRHMQQRSNAQEEILTRQLRVGEYINSLPTPNTQTLQFLPSDTSGSSAILNGFVVKPPSYRDVIDPSSPIPSVVRDGSNIYRQHQQTRGLTCESPTRLYRANLTSVTRTIGRPRRELFML